MELLNRSAVLVKPRRPYLQWARRDDEVGLAEAVCEGLRQEPTVYLLLGFEDSRSHQEVLEEFWPVLFEAMPEGWLTDGWKTFVERWFAVDRPRLAA